MIAKPIATAGLASVFLAAQAAGIYDPAKLAALEERVARLEAKVQDAESIRAIKRLQNAYGHYAELGLWNDFADLFAENAAAYYPAGKLEGKEAVRKLFFQDVGRGKLGLDNGRIYPHLMLQPVITLGPDGNTAKGRWGLLAMLGGFGGNANWSAGVYENEYARIDGVWQIRELHSYVKTGGAHGAEGWRNGAVAVPTHFDAARAGAPGAAERPGRERASSSSLGGLQIRAGGLLRRAGLLNDESEIANLQHAYGYYLDRKMWDQLAGLFARRATMEWGQMGVYAGKNSIRRALNQFGAHGLREGEVHDHVQLQLIVHVAADRRSAKARGDELVMTGVNGESARLEQGLFENEYVKQDGVWKIQSVHYEPRWITDYAKGWGKDAEPAPGRSKEYPPDRPPTTTYETYPKFHILPFHFVHPVTGRRPQYPAGVMAPREVAHTSGTRSIPSIGSMAELEIAVSTAERKIEMALAYDAAENLTNAYGHFADELMWNDVAELFTNAGPAEAGRNSFKARSEERQANSFTIRQILQPVIHVSPDAKSAKIRARLLEFDQGASGRGEWAAGIYESEAVEEGGSWRLAKMTLDRTWTAGYREGWSKLTGGAKGPGATSFHYKNPVTGR
jgi:hypothetical protein